jgi:hypothetical protein
VERAHQRTHHVAHQDGIAGQGSALGDARDVHHLVLRVSHRRAVRTHQLAPQRIILRHLGQEHHAQPAPPGLVIDEASLDKVEAGQE